MEKAGSIIAYLAAWLKELIWTMMNTKKWLADLKTALNDETTTEA